jgi:hypothetical protein
VVVVGAVPVAASFRHGVLLGTQIIVGSAGDEARTENVGEARSIWLLNLVSSRTFNRG